MAPSFACLVNLWHLYVDSLCTAMQQLLPVSVRLQDKPSHISKDLHNGTHVFVRHDTVCKPLQPTYDGPLKVLARSTEYVTVNINGKPQTISLDRLKEHTWILPTCYHCLPCSLSPFRLLYALRVQLHIQLYLFLRPRLSPL